MKTIEKTIIVAAAALVILFSVNFVFGTISYRTNETFIEVSHDVTNIFSHEFRIRVNNTEEFHIDVNRTSITNILNLKIRTTYPSVAQAGDIIIINNVLCFYDGTGWKKAAGTGGC